MKTIILATVAALTVAAPVLADVTADQYVFDRGITDRDENK